MQTIDLKHLKLKPNQRVLDLGCGEGRHAQAVSLLTEADVFAVDINFSDVKKVRAKLHPFATEAQYQRCHSIVSDGLHLPFANNSFDVIICSEVLEHIHEYTNILSETDRVLKPGGVFSVSVPRAWPERLCWWLCKAYHQVEGGHVRIFNAKNLRNKIECKGFTFTRKHWAHALHSPYWWLRCLFWRQGEHFAPVRLYHKFLVWDLMQKPRTTQYIERILNPLMGKSVAMYFIKNDN